MTRASGIAGAFVVALALTPISADAQQIFACVNSNSGAIRIVAQGATCPPSDSLVTWNVVGPQGPPGPAGPPGPVGPTGPQGPAGTVLAFMQCPMEVTIQSGAPLLVTAAAGCSGGVASILTDGGGAARSSGTFLMQPGTYHLEFYAETGADCSAVTIGPPGGVPSIVWLSSSQNFCLTQTPIVLGIIAGAAIMQFGPNQSLNLNINSVTTNLGFATLIIMKLQ